MTSNSDPLELQRFSQLAHRWWDPQGDMRPLHQINPLRLEWLQRHTPLTGRRVLDVGCGGGLLSEAMAAAGASVTGIDLAAKLLKVAELHALETGIRIDYRQTSAEELAAHMPGTFEVVTCMEMLEHVPDPARVVAACARLAKPGGRLFFSTINRNPKSFLFAIVGAEYVLKLLPRGTHEYEKFIKPSELSAAARDAGLRPLELIGLTYNPFSGRYALGPDTGVNYLMAFERQS
jgi:2-polyprenyl-6-hydroxyphenyl methylase/3-demethylubiquinone-9 3-methyltransferase